MLTDQGCDLIRPFLRSFPVTGAGAEVIPRQGGAHFVYGVHTFCEESLAAILEHDHRSLGGDEDIPVLVVRAPNLHVGNVRGVPGVQLIVKNDAGIVVFDQLVPDPGQAVFA